MPGSTDELSGFIQQHRAQLLAFVERSLGPALRAKVEAEDILQDVGVSAVASPEQFQVAGRDWFKLLCQLAEQRIIDAHRHHVGAQKRTANRERALSDHAAGASQNFADLLIASITSPSAAFSRNQKEFRLQQALAELPEEQRLVLRLRFVDGLATKEIAEQIGKSDGAVRVMLSRTIGQLQQHLGDAP